MKLASAIIAVGCFLAFGCSAPDQPKPILFIGYYYFAPEAGLVTQIQNGLECDAIAAGEASTTIKAWLPGGEQYEKNVRPYQGAEIAGVVWAGGHPQLEDLASYQDDLEAIIAGLRETFDDPTLPVFILQTEPRGQNADKEVALDLAEKGAAMDADAAFIRTSDLFDGEYEERVIAGQDNVGNYYDKIAARIADSISEAGL